MDGVTIPDGGARVKTSWAPPSLAGDIATHHQAAPHAALAASVLQASGFRSDVTVFRLNAARAGDSGLEPAFRRKTAERVYRIEAAHNPEVAGSNPAPATKKGPQTRAFRFLDWPGVPNFLPLVRARVNLTGASNRRQASVRSWNRGFDTLHCTASPAATSSVAYTPARRLIASGPPARLVVVDTPAR
jgi:hypothetical protein